MASENYSHDAQTELCLVYIRGLLKLGARGLFPRRYTYLSWFYSMLNLTQHGPTAVFGVRCSGLQSDEAYPSALFRPASKEPQRSPPDQNPTPERDVGIALILVLEKIFLIVMFS